MTTIPPNIDKLECHFKWHPMDNDVTANHQLPILEECDIEGEKFDCEWNDITPYHLNVIGYMSTRTVPPDYIKALEYFDVILLTHNDGTDTYKGHKYIATANKIHTLNYIGDRQDEIAELWKTIDEFNDLSDLTKAVIHGHRGYTLKYFGKSNYPQSIEAFEKAMELDPDNYIWPWGIAVVTGMLRKVEEGVQTVGKESEESNLRKSVELSGEQKATPIVFLAELLFSNARYSPKKRVPSSGHNDPVAMEEAGRLFDKAYQLSPHSSAVLNRCGKFFNMTGEREKGIAMLKEACEINPSNSQVWFRLGQAYRFSKTPDLEKAEEYHLKAVTAGQRRNFFAEVHLGWIRNKRDASYDLVKHFKQMRIHYKNDDIRLGYLDTHIGYAKHRYSELRSKDTDIEKPPNQGKQDGGRFNMAYGTFNYARKTATRSDCVNWRDHE